MPQSTKCQVSASSINHNVRIIYQARINCFKLLYQARIIAYIKITINLNRQA
jgi:hypothetical protein